MPLDRSRPYGEVRGATDGKVYEQDDRWFTASGADWVPPEVEEPSPEEREQVRLAAAQAEDMQRTLHLPKKK